MGASDEQADFPVIFTKALEGRAGYAPDDLEADLRPLFETILDHLPPPQVDPDGSTQLLVTTLEYSSYVGKIAVGRLSSGTVKSGQAITHITAKGEMQPGKVTKLFTYRDLQRFEQEEAQAGAETGGATDVSAPDAPQRVFRDEIHLDASGKPDSDRQVK